MGEWYRSAKWVEKAVLKLEMLGYREWDKEDEGGLMVKIIVEATGYWLGVEWTEAIDRC